MFYVILAQILNFLLGVGGFTINPKRRFMEYKVKTGNLYKAALKVTRT